ESVASQRQAYAVILGISSIAPTSGVQGSTVTVSGTGMHTVVGVAFAGGATAAYTVVDDATMTVTVPAGALTGPIAGSPEAAPPLSTPKFTVKPSIAAFTPAAGSAGTTVTILGGGLTGVKTVKFGSLTAAFVFVSDAEVHATVPAGATNGKISVTTAG